ncbi:MAG: FkbM family methyltransferase [Nitrososphaerota archaeon]|nr:FkbM family methyltransferase [Nitrososphaerota archaeon]
MFSKAAYELNLVRSVAKLFGKRKALKFALFVPAVLISGQNRTAYERIAPCETKIEGRNIIFPHPDARFIDEIVVEGCYTLSPGFQIGPNDTVVDLGANIGIFSILAGIRATNGRVIALEPEEQNYQFLCENVRSNSLRNVEPYRLAISSADGLLDLYMANPGNNTILLDHFGRSTKRSQRVEAISMKSLIARFQLNEINFLKMDVEGSEFQIFRENRWLEQVQRIAMEVHPDVGDPSMIRRKLEEKNFSVKTAPAYDKGLLYFYGQR